MEFNSFFWGGFECADHVNRSGERVNLMKETAHDKRIFEDYKLLTDLGMKVAREGICWSEAEMIPFTFNFDHLDDFYAAAEKYGVQIVWDLCHFGYPEGLIPTHPKFVDRFKALCEAFYKYHTSMSREPLYVVPINEISFLSWHSGDVRGTVPFAVNSGDDIKYHLCQAVIEGIKVLKSLSKTCVVFGVEPLIKIHAADDTVLATDLLSMNDSQFTAMNIVLGRECEELGGMDSLIDVMGVNYYYNNQWNHKRETLPWPNKNQQFIPFSELLYSAYQRFKKPMVLTETGHFGVGRDVWIKEITEECISALKLGVDLKGLCIYPIIDRPDWDDLENYSSSGIWDLDSNKNRLPDEEYLQACRESISMVENVNVLDMHPVASVKKEII